VAAGRGALWPGGGVLSSAGLSFAPRGGMTTAMDKAQDPRAERLAAKLRENLKRRKAQARGMGADRGDRGAHPAQDSARHSDSRSPDRLEDR
jgi:hypothetical protein